jgi:hypothetical protein
MADEPATPNAYAEMRNDLDEWETGYAAAEHRGERDAVGGAQWRTLLSIFVLDRLGVPTAPEAVDLVAEALWRAQCLHMDG